MAPQRPLLAHPPAEVADPIPSDRSRADGRWTQGWRPWLLLGAVVVLTQSVGLAGTTVTDTDPGSWYADLDKPSFNPPRWVFAPVWTTLYALIAIAAWRVWRADAAVDTRRLALAWWVAQLALNGIWTPVFFGMERAGVALVVQLALLVATVVTIDRFRRIDGPAAALMVPYLAWIGFATILNGAIVALN